MIRVKTQLKFSAKGVKTSTRRSVKGRIPNFLVGVVHTTRTYMEEGWQRQALVTIAIVSIVVLSGPSGELKNPVLTTQGLRPEANLQATSVVGGWGGGLVSYHESMQNPAGHVGSGVIAPNNGDTVNITYTYDPSSDGVSVHAADLSTKTNASGWYNFTNGFSSPSAATYLFGIQATNGASVADWTCSYISIAGSAVLNGQNGAKTLSLMTLPSDHIFIADLPSAPLCRPRIHLSAPDVHDEIRDHRLPTVSPQSTVCDRLTTSQAQRRNSGGQECKASLSSGRHILSSVE